MKNCAGRVVAVLIAADDRKIMRIQKRGQMEITSRRESATFVSAVFHISAEAPKIILIYGGGSPYIAQIARPNRLHHLPVVVSLHRQMVQYKSVRAVNQVTVCIVENVPH